MLRKILTIAAAALIVLLLAACSSGEVATEDPIGIPPQTADDGSATDDGGAADAAAPADSAGDDSAAPADDEPGEIVGTNSLIKALRATGATVQEAGDFRQPFFTAGGKLLNVNEQQIQVFQFDSPEESAQVAGTISAEGDTIGNSTMMWIDTPHFYQQGKLIILYVGSDASLTALLESLVGPQVAGG